MRSVFLTDECVGLERCVVMVCCCIYVALEAWTSSKSGPLGLREVGGLEGSGLGSNTCAASTLSFLFLPPATF